MSLRLEMLQVARLASVVLGEEASALVKGFVWSQQCEDGGFSDKDGESDLYYTSFAVDALTALSEELPVKELLHFLEHRFSKIEQLDFVHLCCMARIASALPDRGLSKSKLDEVFQRIESFRTADGGYNQAPKSETGSAYASFLAFGAYSDHNREIINSAGILASLESLLQEAGGWANDTFLPVENVPATAAAITINRNLRGKIPVHTGQWLLNECYHRLSGGFLAFPGAPLPDLLTTAVALHALDGLQEDFSDRKEAALDFVDSLWTNAGGFHGSWEDDDLDVEYTYYGLLALGHLAL